MRAVTGMCFEVCSHALSALAHRRIRPLTSLICVGLIFHLPNFQNGSCSAGSCRHSLILTDPALSLSTEPLLRCRLPSVRQEMLNI
jgi:hypothetical protein